MSLTRLCALFHASLKSAVCVRAHSIFFVLLYNQSLLHQWNYLLVTYVKLLPPFSQRYAHRLVLIFILRAGDYFGIPSQLLIPKEEILRPKVSRVQGTMKVVIVDERTHKCTAAWTARPPPTTRSYHSNLTLGMKSDWAWARPTSYTPTGGFAFQPIVLDYSGPKRSKARVDDPGKEFSMINGYARYVDANPSYERSC